MSPRKKSLQKQFGIEYPFNIFPLDHKSKNCGCSGKVARMAALGVRATSGHFPPFPSAAQQVANVRFDYDEGLVEAQVYSVPSGSFVIPVLKEILIFSAVVQFNVRTQGGLLYGGFLFAKWRQDFFLSFFFGNLRNSVMQVDISVLIGIEYFVQYISGSNKKG